MKRLRYLILALIAAAVFVRSGQGCAFSDDDDMTVASDPDRPYSAYLDGRLGVLSSQLRIRHLVAAYRNLSGHPLTPAEKKAAIDVDQFYNYNGGVGPEVNSPSFINMDSDQNRPALAAWFKAAPDSPTRTTRTVPGENYASFTNCLDDAYVHAYNTLADLRRRYANAAAGVDQWSGDTPEIKDWIAGQNAVFSNCSDGKPTETFGPTGLVKHPAPEITMPQPVPASAPLWLRQARAYQIAAADFYAVRYDQALAGFNAIAADKASPYATLSRYVAARTLIRRATVPSYDRNAPGKAASADATIRQNLTEARDALQAIVRDPAMQQYHAPAAHLLDYVNVRLDPATQAEELARRLAMPNPNAAADAPIDMAYRQNVIDLTYAYNTLPAYSVGTPAKPGPAMRVVPRAPLLRWINDISTLPTPDMGSTVSALFARTSPDQQKDALAGWQGTHQPAWLAAVLMTAQPSAPGLTEAIAAARLTPQSSPAWATVTYHRLRVADESTGRASYDEVAALMPSIEKTQPRSTINLFADLESSLTPSLDLFLKSATRITPHAIQEEPGEGFEANPQYPMSESAGKAVTLCNVPLAQPDTQHLSSETATVFNERMPLRVLRDASLSPVLPGNVRFSIAHMAWTRAVLLDQPAIARSLSPYLGGCQPAFKQWLDAYDNAKTPEERHIAGLMALMRFTSASPTVRPNMEGDFASYDYGREFNWWCDANLPYEGQQQPEPDHKPMVLNQPLVPRGAAPNGQPDPPFLTAADRAQVDRELARLEQIGDAGDYFARGALAWVKAHPSDPRNADVLGFAMRAVRNTCRSNATKELNHQLFEALQLKYPKSEWAMRYKTWE